MVAGAAAVRTVLFVGLSRSEQFYAFLVVSQLFLEKRGGQIEQQFQEFGQRADEADSDLGGISYLNEESVCYGLELFAAEFRDVSGSGRDLESVLKKRENGGKAFLCTAFAAGQIDDESVPRRPAIPERAKRRDCFLLLWPAWPRRGPGHCDR